MVRVLIKPKDTDWLTQYQNQRMATGEGMVSVNHFVLESVSRGYAASAEL